MTAVRRSSRLSGIGATSNSLPPTPDIWRRRQTKIVSSESDDEAEVTELRGTDKENIFNGITTNEINSKSKKTNRKSTIKSSDSIMNTPRRSIQKDKRTLPANKKRGHPKQQYDSSNDEDDEKSVDHVSPPKQRRSNEAMPPKNLLSPTRLLDRLSIDQKWEYSDIEDQSDKDDTEPKPLTSIRSAPRNKYQNARRVLNSAETANLPGREEQLKELREYFSEHLEKSHSGSLYISGQPGTGKTACLSLLQRSPEFKDKFQRVYINCTSIASVGAIYKKLTAELGLQPSGRTERDHLAAIKHYLCHTKKMVLIVLDEIDQLCSSRQSVLYTIFEWPSLPAAKVLLVGIANSLDLTDRMLMRLNARCELKPKLMHFPPYTKQQIIDIFRSRLEEANVLDIFPPVTLQLLAAKVSAVSGDVRRALDIGRHVVEIAEQQKNAGKREVDLNALKLDGDKDEQSQKTEQVEEEVLKPVQVTQVAAILNKVYGASQNLEEDIEESFPLQQKLMLCTLMLMLRKERNKDITMGRLHEVYRRVCTRRNILALDHAEFAGLVDLVQTRGILRIIKKKEPRLHKVQLQWDEDEVNGALKDKQLIASILDDVSCLTK